MDAHPEGKNTVFWTSLREVGVVLIAKEDSLIAAVRNPFCTLQDGRTCYDLWTGL